MLEKEVHLQLRETDIDRLGHVNHFVYHQLLYEARASLLDTVRTEEWRYVVAHVELDHLHEIRHEEGWVASWTRVEEIGRKSVVLSNELRLPNGTVAARGRTVVVGWDVEGRCSRELTEHERRAFMNEVSAAPDDRSGSGAPPSEATEQTAETVLWRPSPQRIEQTTLTRYRQWVQRRLGRELPTYEQLWRWSVEDIDAFWASIWEFFEVEGEGFEGRAMGRREMPGAQWFPGTLLSYPEHVFRGRPEEGVAIAHAREGSALHEMTWGELRRLTARIADGLRRQGVGPGDRVVAYLPNIPEAVAGLLATASLGAVWSSCSPDFGVAGAVDRFAQIEPKVLLAVDGYTYNGRVFDRFKEMARLREALPTLSATVVVPCLDQGGEPPPGTTAWEDFLGEETDLQFTRVPFEHPLWIMYSSGTTGLPKALVQSQGGILLEQLKCQHLHLDAKPGDRVFWYTTTGWMMWNFLVGCLLTGCSILLYDGSPTYPEEDSLWALAGAAGVTCFGTSASYIANCMKQNVQPNVDGRLSALRAVGSTGSPLAPEGFDWVYEQVGSDTWLFSTSGGTDLCTAFVGGVPTLPVYRGELQARALGAAVAAFDEDGHPVTGTVGELVITEPMPSMPIQLWNDTGGRRYRDAYFDVYPGVWRHGDWIEINSHGGAVISGRSDSTINRGGVRMGTSEIYRAVLALDEILDALVVDIDGWMPLFVVLREGATLDADLQARIADRVRRDCSPRHVPSACYAVPELPRTLSNKLLEVPVKRILQGEPPERAASRDSLSNPSALDWFVELARTRR